MLKKFIFIFIIIGLFPCASLASEIFGKISTDPKKMDNEIIPELPDDPNPNNSYPINNISSGNAFAGFIKNYIPEEKEKKKNETEKVSEDKIAVLGISAYADGTLIRDKGKRIFLLENGYKVHIRTIEKLKEYAGQKIHDISYAELSQYKTKNYFINDLIRIHQDQRIYVVGEGGFRHIKSLSELRENYFGKKIISVTVYEFRLY